MTQTEIPQSVVGPASMFRVGDRVVSFRTLLLETMSQYSMNLDDARADLSVRFDSGDISLAVAGDEPTVPTCLTCGCDEAYACDEGCSWASPGTCSRCAAMLWQPRSHAEIDANQNDLLKTANDLYDTALRYNHPEKMLASLVSVMASSMTLHTEILLDIRRASFEQLRMTHELSNGLRVMASAIGELGVDLNETLDKALTRGRLLP